MPVLERAVVLTLLVFGCERCLGSRVAGGGRRSVDTAFAAKAGQPFEELFDAQSACLANRRAPFTALKIPFCLLS